MLSEKTHFQSKDPNRLKLKGQNIYCGNSNQQRTGGATLILGKTDFKTEN